MHDGRGPGVRVAETLCNMQRATRNLLVLTNVFICTACNLPSESAPSRGAAAAARTTTVVVPNPTASVAVAAPSAPGAASETGTTTVAAALRAPTIAATAPRASTLQLKRLVVAPDVKDREPVSSAEALPSDGSAIYAFAELANPGGSSENVRITFERKGGKERVGDVKLPVPGDVSRHRTWAFTRFIRVPGVWEAVLWSESGAELGRTSFEVKQS